MLRNIFNRSLLKIFPLRSYSKGGEGPVIVLTDDKTTYVAWHPSQDFPYECTRPLPEPAIEDKTSVLKTKFSPEVMEVFKKKSPEQARQELMNITFTTKHRWYPRARDKKAKKTPMDREYL